MVKRVTFQRPVSSNGELSLERGLTLTEADSANVTFSATVGGESWQSALRTRGLPVTRRLELSDAVGEFCASGFGGICRIAPRDWDDLTRAFVEANKRFHEGSVKRPPGLPRVDKLVAYLPRAE